MHQLNVLPINVSKNVDIKDEVLASSSTSPTDDFSQHIDSQLAKNKEVNNYSQSAENKKIDNHSPQTSAIKSAEKTAKESAVDADMVANAAVDNESASNTPEVATSGKKDSGEQIEEQSIQESKEMNDSEKLMSFLLKADKTLTSNHLVEDIAMEKASIQPKTTVQPQITVQPQTIVQQETGVKQQTAVQLQASAQGQAKHDTQLLLKSSELVAQLSSVSQAINSEAEPVVDAISEQETIRAALLASAKGKTNNDQVPTQKNNVIHADVESNDVDLNSFSDETTADELSKKLNAELIGRTLKGELSINDKAVMNNNLANGAYIEQQGNSALTDKEKMAETMQNIAKQLQGDSKLNSKSQIATANDKVMQQTSTFENSTKTLEDLKTTSKTEIEKLVLNADKKQFDVNGKIKDKLSQPIQPILDSKALGKVTTELMSTMASQQTNNNKKFAVGSPVQATGEALIKQNVTIESQYQLNAESVEHLTEQSEEFNKIENTATVSKGIAKPSPALSNSVNFVDTSSRAAGIAQDMIDQQVAEVFNPIGSTEISQSQKTNTQLHQETIAIFRRDFSDAVKDKVMLMISQKLQQFDITLDPPELGNMQVRVNMQGEQATVNFVVQNQQAKEAFEQNMHKLKDLLAEQGVDVGDTNVEQQSQQSDDDAYDEENADNNSLNSMANSADATDVVEHNLSARMINSAATAIDYYA